MNSKGNSFSNGAGNPNGPTSHYPKTTGWDIRPVTHWDWMEGRDPV